MSTKRSASELTSDKPRQKKYHRRAVWACDECRLRKIKCSGTEPCEQCVVINHDCSYDGRTRPSWAPTKRIRILEDTLRAVRTSLWELKGSGVSTNLTGIDQVLGLLDPSDLEDDNNNSTSTPTSNAVTPNVEAPTRLPAIDTGSRTVSFGRLSGFSIIRRMTELFSDAPGLDHRALQSQQAATELFCPQSHHKRESGILALPVPGTEDMAMHYEACFMGCYLLFQPISELDFVNVLSDVERGILKPAAEPLLYAIAALGILTSIQGHSANGCSVVQDKSYNYFQIALSKLDLGNCQGLMALQTVLCLVLYSMSCSNLTAAHTYSCTACSWILQLGIHRAQRPQPFSRSIQSVNRILILTLKLHSILCATLDLPPLLLQAHIDPTILAQCQNGEDASAPQSNMRSESTWLSARSLYQYQLLNIVVTGLNGGNSHSSSPSASSREEFRDSATIGQLGCMEGEIQELVERASNDIMGLGDKVLRAHARRELEMTAYLCQMLIHMPLLPHTASMANGSSTSKTRSQRVLACIKVASKTIALCGTLLRDGLLEPASWIQTYTLFLAVLTLVYLIAAHKGTTHPGEAWKQAEQGIRILATLRCHQNGATRCLRVIRALVVQLSHTVEFDMDDIERTTLTLCITRNQEARQGVTISQHDDETYGHVRPPTRASDNLPMSTADSMLAQANDLVIFGNGD